MDENLDRKSQKIFHPKSREIILQAMDTLSLSDVWRTRNKESKKFTWMQHNSGNWSRIDYFLVSESLGNKCEEVGISPSICTDHSCISLTINTSETKRGPGIWKFNNELLRDEEFIELMTDLIKGCVRSHDYMESIDFWEVLKFEMIQCSKEFSKKKAQK